MTTTISRLGEVKVVPRSMIVVGERFRKEYTGISELKDSLSGPEGLISPLAVRDFGDHYELAAGGRRIKAIDELKWQDVTVRIYPAETDELTIKTVELAENIQRKQMTYSEEVAAMSEIHNLYVAKFGQKVGKEGHSIRDTAKLLGVSHTTVADNLKLAKAIKEIPQLADCKNQKEATSLLDKVNETIMISEVAKRADVERLERPDKVRDGLIHSYIVDDFFRGSLGLQVGSYDLIEIDPPYGVDFKKARDDSSSKASSVMSYNEVDKDAYQLFLQDLFRQCYKLAATNSWMIVWFAFEPWANVVYEEITKSGFRCSRRPALWIKPSGMAASPNTQLASDVESFYYARKGDPGIVKAGRSSYYQYSQVTPANKIHPTERPIEMIEEVLTTFAYPGSHVLVPFAGSGNTLLAAHNLNMRSVGFDLSKEYRDAYTLRVSNNFSKGNFKSYD